MILDTFPHPTRPSIRALRTFFRIAILASSCALSINSFVSAVEVFDHGTVIRAKVDEQLTAPTGILGTIAGHLSDQDTGVALES